MSIPLDLQIKCLSNEVERRKKSYPKLIESGRMSDEKAALEIEAMSAAFRTLSQLKGLMAS